MDFLRKILFSILIFNGFASGGIPTTIEGYFTTLYQQCGTILRKSNSDCKALGKEVAREYKESILGSGVAPKEIISIVEIVEEVCQMGCQNRGKKGERIIESAVVKYQTLEKNRKK
ncbi:MAG: hypothetical protein C6I01_06885 [Epsilonproteobacteria bacterium]|nr:hypothetical protein [Campylobacterota bacterium]NPA89161.1 hypothetical protein [Campylobacterota bacterium]